MTTQECGLWRQHDIRVMRVIFGPARSGDVLNNIWTAKFDSLTLQERLCLTGCGSVGPLPKTLHFPTKRRAHPPDPNLTVHRPRRRGQTLSQGMPKRERAMPPAMPSPVHTVSDK